jgi:quercetin 2,3-dioxygenase
MKRILGTYSAPGRHWVGDGFPVRSMFSYNSHGEHVSPFLLLDHAGPMDFSPAEHPRGVGEHPHRGFETVTIVYDGEVEHLDSTGAGGRIGAGDVQWMTAGSGILHQEFHSREFTRQGGRLEMVQLWVNLPAVHKMTSPGYQTLLDTEIPAVDLPDKAGVLRVIAGDYDGHRGPARTFTPMQVWDVRLTEGGTARFELPDGWNSMLVVLDGTLMVNDSELARSGELVLLDQAGEGVVVEANNTAKLLVLAGEPINEPIVGHGPFVMNTDSEIRQAIHDYSTGGFGRLSG